MSHVTCHFFAGGGGVGQSGGAFLVEGLLSTGPACLVLDLTSLSNDIV